MKKHQRNNQLAGMNYTNMSAPTKLVKRLKFMNEYDHNATWAGLSTNRVLRVRVLVTIRTLLARDQ